MSTHQHGFTLLETLVALSVLAIALTASLRALGHSTDTAAELQDRTLAHWIVQNRLALYRAHRTFPSPGHHEGHAQQNGQDFVWRERVSATPNPLFRRIEVEVFDRDAGRLLAHGTGYASRPLR